MEITGQTLMNLTAAVLGLTELAKQLGLPSKVAPLVALTLGILFSALASTYSTTFQMLLQGVILGLSASGLWSVGKNSIELLSSEK